MLHPGPYTIAVAGWLAAVASTTAWAAIRSRAGRTGERRDVGKVALLRPCAGAEPGLARALASTAEAGVALVRFAVATEDDPALPVAREAARSIPGAEVIVTSAEGPNAKADQLARALASLPEPPDVVLAVDSDVELTPAVVAAVLAPLADPGVAAAWAPPIEVEPDTFADRASSAVLGASMHAFAVLGALDPGCVVGKVLAIRREALEAVGGFAALRTHLGEDMELGRRLREARLRVVRASVPARSLAKGRAWDDVVSRYARWVTVIRAQRPHLLASYPLLFASTIPMLLVCLAAAPFEGLLPLGVAGAALALRHAVAALAVTRSGSSAPLSALDALAADVVLLLAFHKALRTTTVRWRDTELRVARGGQLEVVR